MAKLNQFLFQLSVHTSPKRCFFKPSLRTVRCTLIVLGIMIPWSGSATAQQEPSSLHRLKADREIKKLELEIDNLTQWWPEWRKLVVTVMVAIITVVGTIWVARRTRFGALDQSLHDERLKSYPQLVNATAPLAVYFPSTDSSGASIVLNEKECFAMGQAMSAWYFEKGGLLLSAEARDAYFLLARALTLASRAKNLRVPTFPKDAEHISKETVATYQKELEEKDFDLDDVENWIFGDSGSESDKPFLRFRDFVFLQHLSSVLRTKLTDDLRSRRQPS